MMAKLSSASIIPGASLLTSVPARPTAMPASASLRAGAWLTPSPVMATTCPWGRKARTSHHFCRGETRANIVISRKLWPGPDGSSSSSWLAVTPRLPGSRRPASRARAATVGGQWRGRLPVGAGAVCPLGLGRRHPSLPHRQGRMLTPGKPAPARTSRHRPASRWPPAASSP